MDKKKEREILEKALDLNNSASVILFNFHAKMNDIKSDMKKALDLMDDVANGNREKKQELRKHILDDYNDLPRKSLEMIEELTEILKNKE